MDFGAFPPLKRPAASVSGSVIVYRNARAGLEVLTSVRQCEPWKGCTVVGLGGYVNPEDASPKATAVREALEESGLEVQIEFLVGIYGPERYRHSTENGGFRRVTRTEEPAHIRPVVDFCFAGRKIGGGLRESDEQRGFAWTAPRDLVGVPLGFDCVRQLADFLKAMSGSGARFSVDSIR